MKILAIYDQPESIDRYTVYFDEKADVQGKYWSCLAMSSEPFHPMGFCQHSSGMLGRHNGKRISFDELPDKCKQAVNYEMEPLPF